MANTRRIRRKRLSPLLRRLQRHLGISMAELPVFEDQIAPYERPNLQLAIDGLLARRNTTRELLGIVALDEYRGISLARLSREKSAATMEEGPVEHLDVAIPGGGNLACVKRGLYLIRESGRPIVLLITPSQHAYPPHIQLEVMGSQPDHSQLFLRQLTSQTRQGKAFRGHVLSLEEDCHGQITVRDHQLPPIRRTEVILPEPLLNRIERHTLSFTRHAARLRAAGRHIKRGILLYGPPGTGKTLSAMYLVAEMPGRTVLLMTGAAIRSIEAACRLARMLEPATVVLEDVDLIGTERGQQEIGANALLFELLNQMDGLANDADILFVLTTNRPDVLEPALAARPGRIDQAIEVPPPDADCRRRLFNLFGKGLRLEIGDWDRVIQRTAGATGAFIRELLRKAAVYAAEENSATEITVADRHLNEAMGELLVEGGPLTKSLLGMANLPGSGPAGTRRDD